MINSANSGQQQAWTPEYVRKMRRGYGILGDIRIADAHDAAIAAAYTEAFIDVRSELESRIEALTQQLAAERSKVLQLESFGEQLADCQEKYNFKANLTQEIVELNQQLAAECQLVQWCEVHAPTKDEPIKCCPACEAVNERQRREHRERENKRLAIDYGKLNDQLLSALAAIDKKDVALDHLIVALQTSGFQIREDDVRALNIKPDLSALHEHDAEVRQDQSERDEAYWKDKFNAEVREPLVEALKRIENPNHGHDLAKCRAIARDALAKAKEQ